MRVDPRLQQRLGIELPIIQAPMAGVQGSALAVAVCNAGGLGSLPGAMLGVDVLREELAALRQLLGERAAELSAQQARADRRPIADDHAGRVLERAVADKA